MLELRDGLVKAMFAAMREERVPKIARSLRQRLPAQTRALDDAALERWVRETVGRAATHGLEVEWDLQRFVWLELIHGPRFDESCPWAASILAQPRLSGTIRADMLESYHRNYLEDGGGSPRPAT